MNGTVDCIFIIKTLIDIEYVKSKPQKPSLFMLR